MTLKYYYDLMSQPCRALYIFLKKTQIPFEPIQKKIARGEHVTDEFKKINPLGLLPVIDDSGRILRESVGILRYLCREKNVPDHWYPKDSYAQAKVDEYLEWQHLGIRMACSYFCITSFFGPLRTKKPLLESEVNKSKKLMITKCNEFEYIWLKDNCKFLFGDELTIADLLAAAELEQPRVAGYDPRTGRPRITGYLERVKCETNPFYEEASTILERVIQLQSEKNFKVL